MFLESIGADAHVHGAFQRYEEQGLTLARVAMSQRDQYRLYIEDGELDAEPSGGLWHRSAGHAAMPVTGDWVAVRVVGPGEAIVEAVLPRRTFFSRRAAGRREEEQAIAANIDLVFLVCGLDGDFNLRRLERYLALAFESGASPVVVLNKADLCADVDARIAEAVGVAGRHPVLACSAARDEGFERLQSFLGRGTTVALLGSSGAGKSTIVNRLLGEERFRTQEVRQSDSRGKHTTTHRELVVLPGGGALIDTPGMRELQLWSTEESIGKVFDEIEEAAGRCRFSNCTHQHEPGCEVASAIAAGAISPERWTSYRKLLGEARRHELLTDGLAAAEEKKRLRSLFRSFRRRPRLRP